MTPVTIVKTPKAVAQPIAMNPAKVIPKPPIKVKNICGIENPTIAITKKNAIKNHNAIIVVVFEGHRFVNNPPDSRTMNDFVVFDCSILAFNTSMYAV